MSLFDNYQPTPIAEHEATVARVLASLAMPRDSRPAWVDDGGFERVELSRAESDACADRAEARETAAREWRASE